MDCDYYQKQLKLLGDLTEKSSDKQETFFQQILIANSGILGILVALHSIPSTSLCIRLVFVIAIVLFSLGILSTGITLYDHSMLVERVRQAFRHEAETALKNQRKLNVVSVEKKKRTLFFEKCSLFFPVFGLIALVIYTILITFIQC